jgi:hypothetical protein
MVRAILSGAKTQTRRVVKPQPTMTSFAWLWVKKAVRLEWGELANPDKLLPFCPYGQPGDRLWVREEHYRFGHWEPVPGVQTKGGRQKWKFVADTTELRYNDNAPEAYRKGMHKETPDYRFWHKRLARFMPRIASRITLEITKVRVERLQDIREDDAIDEGIETVIAQHKTKFCRYSPAVFSGDGVCVEPADCACGGASYVEHFAALWESINGPDSWAANPWVWVIEFRRVKP